MRSCARARRRLMERETGALDDRLAPALREHLAGCRSCAAYARASERLAGDLMRLRGTGIEVVDVVPRVMARIAVAGPPAREAVPPRQRGWIAAWAAAVALAILATAVAQAGLLVDALERSADAARGLAAVGLALLAAARRSLGPFGSLGVDAAAGLGRLVEAAGELLPSLPSLALVAIVVVSLTTVLVLRRDFRRAGAPSKKES